MKKLKIAFLWHQHQPYYKLGNEFILPWVLFHGTKDYYDIPEVLYEFPNIRQTFNFAPSLSLQLDEYIQGQTKDRVQRLTAKNHDELTDDDKREILDLFFHANYDNMIAPFPRYWELLNKANNSNKNIYEFSNNDWLDLQVWYNLAWFGYYSRQSGIIRRLINKERNFTEIEKKSLIEEQYEVLKKINYQYRKLKELSQIEISCSPMFHPILPLLIDSSSAHEARPGQSLPNPPFNFPEDAELQLKMGLDYFNKTFDFLPQGVWPSEGSVSDDTLKMLIQSNISWIATDEQVLFNSLENMQHQPTEKFFPRKFNYDNGEITVFFRDHFLSDRIGFTYSKWNERDAANDFCHHLRSIRNEIIKNHGEDALDYACVSVILDGENCWEYYHDNGIPFLRELYSMLSNSEEIITTTFSDSLSGSNYLPPLQHIVAGSWINANFDIWIGHNDDLKAWNLLSNARNALRNVADKINPAAYEKALHNLLIAEGSDWFWWYGPEHQTVNKPDFDRLFRHYVCNAYLEMGVEIPEAALIPIEEQEFIYFDNMNNYLENNSFKFLISDIEKGVKINLKTDMSAMHRIGDILQSLEYYNDNENVFLKINFISRLTNSFEIRLFLDNIGRDIFINKNNFSTDIEKAGILRQDYYYIIILPISVLQNSEKFMVRLESNSNGNLLKFPPENYYEL